MSPLQDLYIRFMVWLGATPPLGYEGSKFLPIPLSNSFRSPLSLDIIEALSSLIGGAGAWFWLRYNIWNAQPWNWWEYNTPGEPYPSWFISHREHLLTLTWPMTIAMAIATIFLARGIRGNIRHFSRLGHIILAWSLIDFLLLMITGSFGIWCLPIQFILALVIAFTPTKGQRHLGDLIAIPFSIGWTILGYWYAFMWWSLIGD